MELHGRVAHSRDRQLSRAIPDSARRPPASRVTWGHMTTVDVEEDAELVSQTPKGWDVGETGTTDA